MNNAFVLNHYISVFRWFPFKLRFNSKIFLILGFILIISLLIFYIFQVNALAEENFKIEISQKKTDKLTQENEILSINSLKLNSLPNIETLIKDFGFEKVQKINYVQILESQVAKK